MICPAIETRKANILHLGIDPRAFIGVIGLLRGSFEEAQGGVGFGAVVVARVEALEGFRATPLWVIMVKTGASSMGKNQSRR